MEMHRIKKILLSASFICLFPLSSYAESSSGLYTNGQWDSACAKCWSSPHTSANNHCKPSDCAIHGYYHCKQQNPPLAVDDDPRLISLIHAGECTYVPKTALNEGEANYIESMKYCTHVLDKMAGRFTFPANPHDASRFKMDFYLTHFKATALGSPAAHMSLAMKYDLGVGTQQDREKATEMYQKAATKGLPFAQYAMAARYAYGITLPKDKDKAIMWLNKVLHDKPLTQDDQKSQALVAPCAIKMIERLTPS